MNLRRVVLYAFLASSLAGCLTEQVLRSVAPPAQRRVHASVRGAAAWRVGEGLHLTLAYDDGRRERWDVRRPPAGEPERPWQFAPCTGGDEHALSDWPTLVPFGSVRVPAEESEPELVLREDGAEVHLLADGRRLARKALPPGPPRMQRPPLRPAFLLLLPFAFAADVALLPVYGIGVALFPLLLDDLI